MASIDGVSSKDISTYEVTLALVGPKRVRLVSAGMSPQDGIFVDIVGICSAPAGMVLGKPQGIKVLMR